MPQMHTLLAKVTPEFEIGAGWQLQSKHQILLLLLLLRQRQRPQLRREDAVYHLMRSDGVLVNIF